MAEQDIVKDLQYNKHTRGQNQRRVPLPVLRRQFKKSNTKITAVEALSSVWSGINATGRPRLPRSGLAAVRAHTHRRDTAAGDTEKPTPPKSGAKPGDSV